jgi:hypothetical protein
MYTSNSTVIVHMLLVLSVALYVDTSSVVPVDQRQMGTEPLIVGVRAMPDHLSPAYTALQDKQMP